MTNLFISRERLYHHIHERLRQAYQAGLHQGEKNGYLRGQEEGAATLVCLCLEQHLGQLDADLRRWIHTLPLTDLLALTQRISQFHSLAELQAWLEGHVL